MYDGLRRVVTCEAKAIERVLPKCLANKMSIKEDMLGSRVTQRLLVTQTLLCHLLASLLPASPLTVQPTLMFELGEACLTG
jgi:hypothetical protein